MHQRNATHALVGSLKNILRHGKRIRVRGQDTLEVVNQVVVLERPLERCIVTPNRLNNIFASIAETMWILAGRNDLEFLSVYLPRAKDFSDDGVTWRGGYGPRLRTWGGVDQLAEAALLLRSERNTRRAVMSIFDPARDYAATRDVPCNNWIHCYIRDNALTMNIAVRSNDIIWGFSGINTFEWSVIQEILAHWTDATVGSATFFISSLHLYSWHETRAADIVENFPGLTCYETGIPTVAFETPIIKFDEYLKRWFAIEAVIRENPDRDLGAIERYPDPLFRHFLALLRVYNGAAKWPVERLRTELAALPETDLTLAAYEFFARKTHGSLTPNDSEHPRIARWWNAFNGERHVGLSWTASLPARIALLHAEKTHVYGDSWKRRGEVLGVLPNIARKVDRLERALTINVDTWDESTLDTAVDLFIYILKYISLLADMDEDVARRIFEDNGRAEAFSDGTQGFEALLRKVDFAGAFAVHVGIDDAVRRVIERFGKLENCFRDTAAMVSVAERARRAEELLEAATVCVAEIAKNRAECSDALDTLEES